MHLPLPPCLSPPRCADPGAWELCPKRTPHVTGPQVTTDAPAGGLGASGGPGARRSVFRPVRARPGWRLDPRGQGGRAGGGRSAILSHHRCLSPPPPSSLRSGTTKLFIIYSQKTTTQHGRAGPVGSARPGLLQQERARAAAPRTGSRAAPGSGSWHRGPGGSGLGSSRGHSLTGVEPALRPSRRQEARVRRLLAAPWLCGKPPAAPLTQRARPRPERLAGHREGLGPRTVTGQTLRPGGRAHAALTPAEGRALA